MTQSCRRLVLACFVPACLALSTLPALPSLADAPAAPAAAMVQATAQKIAIQNVVPNDVIKQMHWDQPGALPTGVTQISALPAQNALSVTATLAGLAQVREIVKLLDIAPPHVQIKYTLAHASDAELKAAGIKYGPCVTGLPAVHFLQTLTKQGAVTHAGIITTTNNVDASLNTEYGPADSDKFIVTPRVQSDNFVTLALHSISVEGAVIQELNTTRTIQSGGTMLFLVSAPSPGGERLLLFVLPTVLK